MRTPSRRTARERGAAAVEMAIVLPLLLLVIAGIVDFGRFFLVEIQLTNAAREGARVEVMGEPDVTTRVVTAAPSVTGLDVDVTPCPASGGGDATVTASQPDFDWIVLEPMMNVFGGAGALPLAEATAVMRCEA